MPTTITGTSLTVGSIDLTTPLATADGGTGSSTFYPCRAWCAFNGTTAGTNAPIAGGNVSSVTRTSTGYYTINFSVDMPDTLYAVFGTCQVENTISEGSVVYLDKTGSKTVSSVKVFVGVPGTAGSSPASLRDETNVFVQIIR